MKWSTAAGLALMIICLMLANSANFFFHQPFYEIDDWAANSLYIENAKHLTEIYGNYSRWGFHHPGPAFFYLQAFGEWLFFDKLHLVAAPFNGQVLAQVIAMSAFFVTVIAIFTRWLPARSRRWFVPIALIAGAIHFAYMGRLCVDLSYTLHVPSALASPWSAHALVMPTLCLLAAGASVAAGRGEYLPLVALVDGCLVHTHVAQPLFVLPLSFLTYAGLCWQGWRRKRAPWREFPRAHLLAVSITFVFVLPLLLDLRWGKESNLAHILQHMHRHHEEHKTLARSVLYFLQFATYTAYWPLPPNEFGWYDWPGMQIYLRRFAWVYAVWAVILGVALWPLALNLLRRDKPTPSIDVPTRRFLAWAGAFALLDLVLTLYWGTIQDGPMVYFNSWFNYSLYLFVFLMAVAAICARPASGEAAGETVVAAGSRPAWWWGIGSAAAVLAVWGLLANRLRIDDPNAAADAATRASVVDAIEASNADDAAAPVPKLLAFPHGMWQVAVGVAVQLQRAGQPFVVPKEWAVIFDHAHIWPQDYGSAAASPLQVFHFYLPDAKEAAPPPVFALKRGFFTINPPTVDPTGDGSTLDFSVTGNALDYRIIGWSDAEPWGTWNDGDRALLAFHPRPTGGGDVELTMDIHPLLEPDKGIVLQHMSATFDGQPIGGEQLLYGELHPAKLLIPAQLWNRAAARPSMQVTTLELRFPDAATPPDFTPNGQPLDARSLAVGFRRIDFREREPGYQPPGPPPIDPANGTTLDFRTEGNSPDFSTFGWSKPEEWGSWNEGNRAGLLFRPVPVADGRNVQVAIRAHPLLDPDKGLTRQRLRVRFNGEALGGEQTLTNQEATTLTFLIPAERWRRAGQTATLEFEMPDTAIPAVLHPESETDRRRLAVGFEEIRFQEQPSASP